MKFATSSGAAFKAAADTVKPIAMQAIGLVLITAFEHAAQALYRSGKDLLAKRFGATEPPRQAGPTTVRSPLYDGEEGEEGYECPHCGGPLDEIASVVAADLHNGRRGEPVHDERPGVH